MQWKEGNILFSQRNWSSDIQNRHRKIHFNLRQQKTTWYKHFSRSPCSISPAILFQVSLLLVAPIFHPCSFLFEPSLWATSSMSMISVLRNIKSYSSPVYSDCQAFHFLLGFSTLSDPQNTTLDKSKNSLCVRHPAGTLTCALPLTAPPGIHPFT